MSAAKTDTRRRLMQLVHIGKSKLGLADADYRLLLLEATGVMSSACMNDAQLNAVLAEMKRRGFRPTGQWKNKPKRPKPCTAAQMCKVEALLADAGRPWNYAHHLGKKMFRTERLEWLNSDQMRKLIAALQIDADRRALRAVQGTEKEA